MIVIPPPPKIPGGYRLIYADPPWTFVTHSHKGKGKSAERHYECMDLQAIEDMGHDWLLNRAALDAILLMWVTDPMLESALAIINKWCFTYKTVGFTWVKMHQRNGEWIQPIGTGYWTRANPEMCLLATRGRPIRLHADVRQLVIHPRGEHSRKPPLYDQIERLAPGPYLELFARWTPPRPNWTFWGAESTPTSTP